MPGLVVSAVCLAIVFYLADLRKLAAALRLADYRLVVIVAAISLLWLTVRSCAWRTLLQEMAGFRDVFLTVNAGYLLNNLLPFRLGELGRVYLLSRRADLGFWQVFPSVLIERALDLLIATGLLLSTLPFVVGASWAQEAALAAGGVVLAGLVVLYLLAHHRDRAMAWFERLGSRWPWILRAGRGRLPAFFDGLASLTNPGRFLRAIAWMLLNWGVGVAQYYLLLLAFIPNARLLWAAFGLGVLSLGIAAPSSPGAVGVMELSLVAALSLFDLDPSVALAFAFTLHLLGYLITGILGAYALAQDGASLGHVYRQVRNVFR